MSNIDNYILGDNDTRTKNEILADKWGLEVCYRCGEVIDEQQEKYSVVLYDHIFHEECADAVREQE